MELEPRGRFGRPFVYRESTESTQLLLKDDPPEGAVAVADEQTAGRGRLGRTWDAPAGTAILCSVALRPPADRRIAELSLVGGMAAADAIEQALGLAAQIKWPNDVMVNRFKVAGVLAEAREGIVVLGIGINVNQTREQMPEGAASLRTIDGVTREREPILADVLERLEQLYERWLQGGVDAIYDSLGARDFLRGRRVSLDGTSGIAVGIDREGRLELDIDGERKLVESGEVTYER
ncbi:MAG TPA: biotin--[acetyl-CoA-carboxylase] ligase [Gaiellaceae bacterium]|jgi:BirA family biotin operon repressor/biotin-[acetyl-CoA-carboxylase] ligase|nr:biotin--[acetyl-CoA-carboxylase] ligase [Gaiellaceae bacterium]